MSVQLSAPDVGEKSGVAQLMETVGLFAKQKGMFRRILAPVWGTWAALIITIVLYRVADFGAVIFSLMCVVMPGALVLYAASAVWWRRQLGAMMDLPTIHATSDVLQRGDPLDIEYRQHFKKATEIESLRVQLTLREWVRYTQGTSTHTDTRHIVMDEDWIDMQAVSAGEDFTHTFKLRVPDNAMHTWETASDNKITWHVVVELDMPGWVDLRNNYNVMVQPEPVTNATD